jgi:hypothetical protein
MKKVMWVLSVIGLLLALAGPAAAASTSSLAIGNDFVCKDMASVMVTGSSSYATNRVRVSVYLRNDKGEYKVHQEAVSENFGSGDFSIGVVVSYTARALASGAEVRIDAQLQRQSGGNFDDLGSVVSAYAQVTDKHCLGKCAVTISTGDKAPAKGTLTLRTHFGAWFRPEGRLYGAVPVNANALLRMTFVGLPCGAVVRAWYYPATGKDRTPRMLPAQYWPTDFGVDSATGAIVYTTSFKKGLPATRPLESDDPYAPR